MGPTSGPGSTAWSASTTTCAPLDWSMAKPDPAIAVRLAFALWRFWQQRGYLNEARARFEALEAQGWDLDPRTRARFDEAFGGIAYWQSDQQTATRLYDDALDLAGAR